jgi:hypothetical protein
MKEKIFWYQYGVSGLDKSGWIETKRDKEKQITEKHNRQ